MNLRHLILATFTLLLTTTISSAQIYRVCPIFNMGPADANGNFMYAATKYEVDTNGNEVGGSCGNGITVMYISGAGEEAYCLGAGDCSDCATLQGKHKYDGPQTARANTRKNTPGIGDFVLTKQRYIGSSLKSPNDIKFDNCLIPDRLNPAGKVSVGTRLKDPTQFTKDGYVSRNGAFAKVRVLIITRRRQSSPVLPLVVAFGVECSNPGAGLPVTEHAERFTPITQAESWEDIKDNNSNSKITSISDMKLVKGEIIGIPLYIFAHDKAPWVQ